MIDRNFDTPVYMQLADIIRSKIASGEIKPGDKLESETVMTKKYDVARLTVREALNILVNENLIEKHQGKGSFCKNIANRKKIHVLLNISDFYFVPYYTQSISKMLQENNADFIACDTRNSNDEICTYLEQIASSSSEGVIVQACPTPTDDPARLINAFAALKEKDIPYIIIDYKYDFIEGSYIIPDEYSAGVNAAQCFKDNGHTSLAAICIENDNVSKLRLDGFCTVSPVKKTIYFNDNLKQEIDAAIREGITGIFCFNDFIAKEVIDILKDKKLRTPDDISIISVDDTIIANIYSLTSVIHPKNKIGEEAAKAILNNNLPIKKVFKTKITIRNSVKKL